VTLYKIHSIIKEVYHYPPWDAGTSNGHPAQFRQPYPISHKNNLW